MNHEGPTPVTIPARAERTALNCFACKHFERRMIRSGRNPVYHSLCHHPDAESHRLLDADGRQISLEGKSETPEWCPVRKEKA